MSVGAQKLSEIVTDPRVATGSAVGTMGAAHVDLVAQINPVIQLMATTAGLVLSVVIIFLSIRKHQLESEKLRREIEHYKQFDRRAKHGRP